MHHALLHDDTFTDDDVASCNLLVNDIACRWSVVFDNRPPVPKTHMLLHCAQFAARHRVLGRLSEAQVESCHGVFSESYHRSHLNTQDISERLRRSLADRVLNVMHCVLTHATAKKHRHDGNVNVSTSL